MKGIIKLVGLAVLAVLAFILILALLATIICISPFAALCFIAYQVKEYFVYRKSANNKLAERKALKKKTVFDIIKQGNENT